MASAQGEIVKVSSSVLNQIFQRKINLLKKWFDSKELDRASNHSNVLPLLSDYLNNLSISVSVVTSIAFPQHKLNIEEAYEPLKISLYNPYESKAIYSDLTVQIIEKKGKYLLVDSAGMGKSTFSKYLVSQLLYKTDRIPLLFELRHFDDSKALLQNLLTLLDKIGDQFESALFERLIRHGMFIIILDGFDEVRPDLQAKLAKQVYDLSNKGGDNSLVVTSRPQEVLPDLLDGTVVKFENFSIAQAVSLVQRYDKVSNLDIGKKLASQLELVPKRFTESPLLVSLLYIKGLGVRSCIVHGLNSNISLKPASVGFIFSGGCILALRFLWL